MIKKPEDMRAVAAEEERQKLAQDRRTDEKRTVASLRVQGSQQLTQEHKLALSQACQVIEALEAFGVHPTEAARLWARIAYPETFSSRGETNGQ